LLDSLLQEMILSICSKVISTRSCCQFRISRSIFLSSVCDKGKAHELAPFKALPDLENPTLNPLKHAELLKAKVAQSTDSKVLRVAILGIPNSGKSTLVNKLVGHHICPQSVKPNTTRKNAKAVLTSGDTQVVFLDTPGVVEDIAAAKYKMEKSLLLDPEASCSNADLLVVLHDVSNRYVREALNKKVLRLLCLYYKAVPSILVLNKMDTIPKSRRVLDLIRKLTCNRLDGEQGQLKITKDSKKSIEKYLKRKARSEQEESIPTKNVGDILQIASRGGLTEEKTSGLISGLLGWPGFNDVFTISALNGDGVEDLREYLFALAKPGRWKYHDNIRFDDDPRNIVINIIKSKFLDHLPKNVPYELTPEIQMWEIDPDWNRLRILATVDAKNKLQLNSLLGYKGSNIKSMSDDIQNTLIDFFSHEVHFVLSVIPKFSTAPNKQVTSTVKPNIFL